MKKNSRKTLTDSEKMCLSLHNGDNVAAYKLLEKMMKKRVSAKIEDALKNMN